MAAQMPGASDEVGNGSWRCGTTRRRRRSDSSARNDGCYYYNGRQRRMPIYTTRNLLNVCANFYLAHLTLSLSTSGQHLDQYTKHTGPISLGPPRPNRALTSNETRTCDGDCVGTFIIKEGECPTLALCGRLEVAAETGGDSLLKLTR